MPNLVSLENLLVFRDLKGWNIYPSLQRSLEFRLALGAVKVGGKWKVDEASIESFKPDDWNIYGERRVEVDLGQYTKVLELDYQIEKNRKVRFLISNSKAIATALGVTRFNGFSTLPSSRR